MTLTASRNAISSRGGGLWSVAARLAGWPDDKPLWTASCPCQPFSVAGKGAGVDDPRHLWPHLFRLARAFRPALIVGEQVAGAAGYGWLDGVRADLAGEGYASRGVDFPSCAVDAPHIRQRLYWIAKNMADASSAGLSVCDRQGASTARKPHAESERGCLLRNLADASSDGWEQGKPSASIARHGRQFTSEDGASTLADTEGERWRAGPSETDQIENGSFCSNGDGVVNVGDTIGARLERQRRHGCGTGGRQEQGGSIAAPDGRNGTFWSESEWLACHDGKARRTKPGLRLLVDGIPGRVGLWRIAGNAINPVQAAEVLSAYLETEGLA